MSLIANWRMLATLSPVASSCLVAVVPSTRLSRNRCQRRPVTYKRNLKHAAATYYSESRQLKLPVRSKKATKPNSRRASTVVFGGLRSNFLGDGFVLNTGYLPAIFVTPHDAQVLSSRNQFVETFKVSGDAVSRLTS